MEETRGTGVAAPELLASRQASPASAALSYVLSTLRSVVVEHRVILAIAAVYVVTGGVLQLALRRPFPLALTTPWFAGAWAIGSLAVVLLTALFRRRRLRQLVSGVSIGGSLLVALITEPVHIAFQSVKQSIGPTVGFPLDPAWSALDIWIHRGPAWRLVEGLLEPATVRVFDLVYMLWFPGLLVFLLWCCWSHHRLLRRQAVLAWLLLWIVGGTVGAFAGASAGPCYYEHVVAEGDNPYTELLGRLDQVGFTFARYNQNGVWRIRSEDRWGPFAGISAMPSMHVGFAVLVAIVAWKRKPEAGIVFGLIAIVMQIGSVLLGWHYAIDGYAGALLAYASWIAAVKLDPQETRTPPSA